MNKIVVTGATSMVGVALIKRAVKDDTIERIYAVVRPKSKKIDRLPIDNRVTIIPCDVNEYYKLTKKINDRCDTFYHLAWPRTATHKETYEDISEKCLNISYVLDAVKSASQLGCKNFIGAGSQSEYGVVDTETISSKTPCNPVMADGVLHLAAGQLARIVASNFEIDCIWIRIFSVYGTNDRDNSMVISTINKLMKGEHCAFTKAEQQWDYLNEEDIGNAFYLTGKKIKGSHVYCVGNGQAESLREYIEIIKDVVAPNAQLGFGEIEYPDNPVMNLRVDISDFQKDTGWRPKVDFRLGIEKIYASLVEKQESGECNGYK